MSEAIENVTEEPTANPYNSRKEWHTPDAPSSGSADGLFFEAPSEAKQATREAAPEETKEEGTKRTNYKKRYDDLKKHYDSKLNEFKSREQELIEEATSNRTEYKAPKSPEELEEFKNNYPDVYEVVETVAHLQSETKAKVLEERLSKLQERENNLVRQSAEKRLMERHPDFEDIRNSDDFHGWAKEQPKSIQDWIYSNADDADLASRALDLFKKDFGIEPTKTKSSSKQTRKSAADMVSTKTQSIEANQQKVWSEKEIAAMSIAEFDKNESEISEAMQYGRIVK